MNRKTLTLIVGALLLVIFGLLLFVFQVRKSEVVVVTTFGKPTRTRTDLDRLSTGKSGSSGDPPCAS